MRSSLSCSKYSQSATSMRERLRTIFKKAKELSILCEIEMCVIHYGADGELETWPEERHKVEDIARRYIQLDKALRRRKSITLYGLLKKKKIKTSFMKRRNSQLSDPDQISELISSFQNKLSTFQERLDFVEEKKKKTELDHQKNSTIPSSSQTLQQNPSGQFSLYMYNHGDATLSKILSPQSLFTNPNLFPPSNFTNYSESSGLLSNHESNFQQHPPCTVSNTPDYGLLNNHSLYGFQQHPPNFVSDYSSGLQDSSMNNYGLMQQEPFYGQNMFANSNPVNPCLSNTSFQDPHYYGYNNNMVGNSNTSFSQEFPYPSSSFDESSSLPPFP